MRFYGVVLEFDRNRGSGFIGFGNNHRIYFRVSDIRNYVAGKVTKGQRVSFESERTHLGMRAREVYLKLQPKEEALYFPATFDDSPPELSYQPAVSQEPDHRSEATADEGQKELIAFALVDNKIKLVSLTADGKYTFLDEEHNRHSILYVGFSLGRSLRDAIEEFEWLINDPRASENAFQEFFQRNPDFILNEEYKQAHPHVVLSRDSEHSLIPDFVLEPLDRRSWCDLMELKLPSSEVFVLKKNRIRYSAAVYEAAAQLREYSRFFDEENNRRSFQASYPGLRAYRPRMFVIIGRRGHEDPLAKRLIQTDHPNLVLRTYDELLARMKWKANTVGRVAH